MTYSCPVGCGMLAFKYLQKGMIPLLLLFSLDIRVFAGQVGLFSTMIACGVCMFILRFGRLHNLGFSPSDYIRF